MARQPRSNLPEWGIFHVTARGVARTRIYLDADDYRCGIRLIDRSRRRFDWRLVVYCLMPNHLHIVVAASREGLSRGMHLLNGHYAQTFNDRYFRVGHLFQGRFDARSIEDDDYLAVACDYVLDNPVRAGLCSSRGEWPWVGGDIPGQA